MRAAPDRHGYAPLIPADPDLLWYLAAVSLVALLCGCLMSRVPPGLLRHPRTYVRAVIAAAASRGEVYFWTVWLTLCMALLSFIGALLVAWALFVERF